MNSDVFQLALVVLLALATGVLIPVLLELRTTTRRFRSQLESTGPKLDRWLEDLQTTTHRIEQLSGRLAGGEQEITRLLESAGRVADTLDRVDRGLRTSSAVGAAVGPAVAAFVATLRESRSASARPENHRPSNQKPNGEPAGSPSEKEKRP